MNGSIKGGTITREEFIPYWNAGIYGICSYILGVALLKCLVITILALLCVRLSYGSRWVLRGGVSILVLTVLVWIGIFPPTDQWHDLAAHMVLFAGGLIAAH
jgi:hypothetical protein